MENRAQRSDCELQAGDKAINKANNSGFIEPPGPLERQGEPRPIIPPLLLQLALVQLSGFSFIFRSHSIAVPPSFVYFLLNGDLRRGSMGFSGASLNCQSNIVNMLV